MGADETSGQVASGAVVAALDASLLTRDVCRYGAWAAHRLAAPLACLHVVEARRARGHGGSVADVELDVGTALLDESGLLEASAALAGDARGRLLLQQAGALARQSGDVPVRALIGHGQLVDVLGSVTGDASLVVMGRRGEQSEFERARLGSQVQRVVRGVGRPLLVALRGFREVRTVLVAFEGSESGRRRLEWVARSPLFTGLAVHLVLVGDDSARPSLDWALRTLADAGTTAVGRIVQGDPQEMIGLHADAVRADLLVMGAYGRSRIHQLLMGSTTSMVLQETRIPVLLLH
ncbi:universal stress protein [Luteimonas sp. A501]